MVDYAHRCVKSLGHFTVKITAKSIFLAQRLGPILHVQKETKKLYSGLKMV